MPVKRLNYFHYQFLQENDFSDEQNYHLSMRRRHNVNYHTFGRVQGLDVTFKAGEHKVTINPGMAVDSLGREIIVESNYDVDLQSHAGETVYLVLAFKEEETDQTTQAGVSGNTRITESFQTPKVYSAATAPAWDTSLELILAKITLNPGAPSDGAVINVDMSVRTEAGAKIGEAAVNGVKLIVPDHGGAEWPELLGVKVSAPGSGVQGINVTAAKTTFSGGVQVNGNIELGAAGTVDGRDPSVDGTKLDSHVASTSNPHATTAAQVGALPANGGTLSGSLQVNGSIGVTGTVDGRDVAADGTKLDGHIVSTTNPHATTAAQVGALPATGGTINGTLTVTQSAGDSSYFQAGLSFNGVKGGVGALSPTSGYIAGVEGKSYGSSFYGVAAISETSHYALYVSGTAYFSGAKTGYVTDTFVNKSGQKLHTGDLVKLKGTPVAQYMGDFNKIPVAEVTLADKESDTMTIGIVDRESIPHQGTPDTRIDPDDPTSIADGCELFVVTLGAYAHCKVDASEAPIEVGDLLTSSANPGYAKKATNPKIGCIIGKALEPLQTGTGYISVFVNIQ